ncbi:hypothetical protein ABT215_30825 [Streptomyces sp900105755]|uniref:hypothetical protein n=1 Tax=Streptomyces sp. 900105755 TaxID=3154389 RepID=UPI0033260C1E
MIAQKLLGQDRAAAAVAIDAAQIKGVLPLSALRATFPVFKNPAKTAAGARSRTPSSAGCGNRGWRAGDELPEPPGGRSLR